MKELPPRFNFKDVEDKWIKHWIDNKTFHAQANPDKKPYTIVIPPPNVTGILHMGHALNETLQDIIIRYKRMKGFETLWMPGTDHAGIATQNVVEKQLAKEGTTRHDIGREKLLERLWDWKKQYGDNIIHQLEKLGSSCDWERTRFTMDDGYSEAVKKVFIELYNKGLVYQGKYIINWCPRCHTALSDEEAEHQDTTGALYHIRYPFKDNPKKHVTVATTRPETMLGDTAVAVNPKDDRYAELIGKTLILPVVNREIQIIEDEFVDASFGTGAVKVTPAHDPNDFAMGQRHKLEFVNIMHEDATLNENAGQFEGMDRFEAREALIKTLTDLKVLEKVEEHHHSVGHCYRCDTVVEPYLSKQWFVKMQPLAEPALKVVLDGKVKFYPDRWTKVYTNWMENIRDWCISRQIWWGHRIPAWYCVGDDHCTLKCKEPIVSETAPEKCPHCNSTNLKQDEDVLDTWFSSWLWPFATLGWPEKNKDLEFFYPGDSLFTASEIIFFWVARMVMAGLEFMDDIPFSDVYIHGTVRDAQGRKMSKSLGNALDPLEIIHEYGADALRFSLIINSGQDLFISKEKFEIGRNFANKIWNASRLVLMRMSIAPASFTIGGDINLKEADLPSRWILSRLNSTLEKVETAINAYRYSEAESLIYEFFWNNYCDWYLEIIKNKLDDELTQKVTFYALEKSIQMIHPFMPFVTDELWSQIGLNQESLARCPWPEAEQSALDSKAEEDMNILISIISSIRNTRNQWNIKNKEKIQCHFYSSNNNIGLIENNKGVLESLANLDNIVIESKDLKLKDAAIGLVNTIKFAIPLGGIIDIEQEKKRILGEIDQQGKLSQNIEKRLNNKNFTDKAPKDVIEKDRERLESMQMKIRELEATIKNLG